MRQSPVDGKLLVAQKHIIAAIAIWLIDNELKALCQTLVEAALVIVYRLGNWVLDVWFFRGFGLQD